ncbi:MAG: hypothetical protein U1E05_00120 [Patescibacteria group bacterium]|nr:hypothetical protein [Patescibacteria group bacterium]
MSPHRRQTDGVENPFCTRCVRPGAMDFLFPPGVDATALVDRFQAGGGRGVIIGPHGSGKSTLLLAIQRELASRGQSVFPIVLHDGQRRLPVRIPSPRLAAGTILVVDGYEQLGFWARCGLAWHCRRRRYGLLATSHRPVGLPLLFRTEVPMALAQTIVCRLQEGGERRVLPKDVAREFPRYGGNLRELLFGLFDLYEARIRKER